MIFLKYNLIKNSRNDIDQFLKTVLENRGIKDEDYEEFLASNNVDIEGNTYDNLDNIKLGIETIWKHIENGDIITLVVDPDVDGICSSAILFDYLEKAYKEIYVKNQNKNLETAINQGKITGHKIDKNMSDFKTLQPQGFATTNLTIKSDFYINWDVVTHTGERTRINFRYFHQS